MTEIERKSLREMIRKNPVRLRARTLVALGASLSVLAVPAAAHAVTLTGSGSSAAQPYMLELFKGYSKIHKQEIGRAHV